MAEVMSEMCKEELFYKKCYKSRDFDHSGAMTNLDERSTTDGQEIFCVQNTNSSLKHLHMNFLHRKGADSSKHESRETFDMADLPAFDVESLLTSLKQQSTTKSTNGQDESDHKVPYAVNNVQSY